MNLLIGIPAYNEEKMVGQVVKSIPRKIEGISSINIVLVDDGSTDETGEIARREGAVVLRHAINRGLGGAIKTIIAYAQKLKPDILITFDADGQHSGGDIVKLIKPILSDKADVVIGSRWLKKGHAPVTRMVANKIANIVTYLFFDILTTDSQSGLRAFNQKALNSITIVTDGMEVSSEILKEVRRMKLRLSEIPIASVYTSYSQAKGQPLANGVNVLWQLVVRLLK